MKLKLISAALLLCVFAFSAIACGSSKTSTPGFETYTDNVNGFSISIPDSWETTQEETVTFFSAPSPCVSLYPFGDVVAASAEGYTSAQTYYSEVFEPFLETLDGYGLISKENSTIDGTPAIKVTYTYADGGYSFQEMASILVDQQTLWVIVGSCESTCWNQHVGTFNTMTNSFQSLY
ncbi:MAG: PsbP-related protein [Dehalococcoidia bacterium]|jgi:hypothetical protein